MLDRTKWIIYLYKRRLSCIAYQCYHGLSHDAINSLILKKEHTRSMRDNQKVILGRSCSETGRQTFKHRAAIIWNSLPEGVKRSPSYNSFSSLKKQSNLRDNISFRSSSIVSKKDINNYIYF